MEWLGLNWDKPASYPIRMSDYSLLLCDTEELEQRSVVVSHCVLISNFTNKPLHCITYEEKAREVVFTCR